MRRQARTTALGVFVAVALLAAPPALGAIPGNNGWLAFDSRRGGGDADLYRIAPQRGAIEKRLDGSHPTAEDARPAWGPEAHMAVLSASLSETHVSIGGGGFVGIAGVTVGGRPSPDVVVTSSSHISAALPTPREGDDVCVARYAGLAAAPHMVERVRRTDGFGSSVSECTSQPIAFQSNRGGDYDIWVYDPSLPAGPANPVNLTRYPGAHDTAPAWSSDRGGSNEPGIEVRDHSLIAFESDRHGSRDIFVLDPFEPLGARNPVRLTTSPADDANPEWSPDGRHLVFESTRGGQRDLWSMTVPDVPLGPEPGLVQLTADTLPSFEPAWGVTDPDADDPGGGVLVFSGPEEEGGSCELNVIKWPGRTGLPDPEAPMNTVVRPATRDDAPAVSPQGDVIAFQGADAGAEHLYLLVSDDVDATAGELATPVTTVPGAHRHPSWQPTLLEAHLGYYRPLGRRSKRRPRRRSSFAAADGAALAAAGSPCTQPPTPRLTVSPPQPRPGRPVTLDASASRDADGPIRRYEWDLDGDGRFELGGAFATVRRSYATAGDKAVSVRVLDDDGAVQRARRVFSVVQPAPPPDDCTHRGTPGDDILSGTPGDDVLCGFGGDDVIRGHGGADRISGGAGGDRISGGAGGDRISGGAGGDRISGGAGGDRISGGAGGDRISGGAGGDRISGGAGGDRISGGAGNDGISGGDGDDGMSGGGGHDRLPGGDADDRIEGGKGRDRLGGGGGRDRLGGGTGGDRLDGGGGRDRVNGGPGNDDLRAADGRRDVVRGGPATDGARVDARLDVVRGVEEVVRR